MSDEFAGEGARSRIDEASDWFARMRGPEADVLHDDFRAWLADPRNARCYGQIEQVWSAAGGAREASAFPAHLQRLPRRSSWKSAALIAALVLAVAAIALLLSAYGRSPEPSRPMMAYASGLGQIRTAVLADGSRVTLDTASRVVPGFSDTERRVTLVAGRARFAVAQDPRRPFVVIAGGRAIIARGTLFDVRLDGDRVEVSLLEGKVDVETRQREGGSTPIVRLAPGDRATMLGPSAPRIDIAALRGGDWTRGLIAADGMSLAEVVAEANRYSTTRIELAEPAIGALRVTGAFKPADADTLAQTLSAAFDLTRTTRADGSILLGQKGS